jgi:hypothetical protein
MTKPKTKQETKPKSKTKPKTKAKPKSKVAKKRQNKNDKSNKLPKVPEADSTNVVPIRGGLPVEVLGADETYANGVHLQIVDLMRRYEETYFALAQKLYEVKEKRLYRALDGKYDTFQEYVETAIGIDYRKSKYLTRLWWWYGIEQNANPKLLEGAQEIGWTKAKELIEVVDGRNAARWFTLAKEMNAVDLGRAARVAKKAADEKRKEKAKVKAKEKEREAREGQQPESDPDPDEHPEGMQVLDPEPPKVAQPLSPGDGADDDPTDGVDPPENIEAEIEAGKKESENWVKYRFDVHKDSDQTIKDALHYAGGLAESTHKGNIFSLICLHYNSFHDGQQSVVIGEWLAQLERLTGLSLVALDRRTDEIVYGSELIDELAAIGGSDDDGEPGAGT